MASKLSEVAGNVRKKKGIAVEAPAAEEATIPGLAELAAAEEEAPAKDDGAPPKRSSILAQAILGLAPALVGYALGGNQGGAAGGQIGSKAVGEVLAGEEKDKTRAEEKEEKKKARELQERGVVTAENSAKSDAEYKKRMVAVQEREAGVKERESILKGDPSKLTKEQRIAKLTAEQKKALDLQIMGAKAVQSLKKAYGEGNNTFSLIGDNPFTLAAQNAAESFGRLQSGGAINKAEEDRFLKMLPRPTDSTAIQLQKLKNVEEEYRSRMANSGFTPQEFGIELVDMAKTARESKQGGLAGIIDGVEGTAHAAPAPVDPATLSREEKMDALRKLGRR